MLWFILICNFVSIPLISFLGAWSGADGTSLGWRRIGIPIITLLNAYLITNNLLSLILLGRFGVYCLGYGIPDETPGKEDDGSDIGRFWYKVFNRSHMMADIFTRGTIGLLISILYIWVPITFGNWLGFLASTIIIMCVYVIFGAVITGEGTWRCKLPWVKNVKELLIEDHIIYGITFIADLIIFWTSLQK